jgi:beta-phosphoglucomutase-like phosphatase (HAD superfamily)
LVLVLSPADRYDPRVTEPGRPALFVDRLKAVVFDTDGVLTDTASVHAAASRNVVAVLESAGLRQLFDAEVDGVEAERLGLVGKPDPALFVEGAARRDGP